MTTSSGAQNWNHNSRTYPNISSGRVTDIFQGVIDSKIGTIHIVNNRTANLNIDCCPRSVCGHEGFLSNICCCLGGISSFVSTLIGSVKKKALTDADENKKKGKSSEQCVGNF